MLRRSYFRQAAGLSALVSLIAFAKCVGINVMCYPAPEVCACFVGKTEMQSGVNAGVDHFVDGLAKGIPFRRDRYAIACDRRRHGNARFITKDERRRGEHASAVCRMSRGIFGMRM